MVDRTAGLLLLNGRLGVSSLWFMLGLDESGCIMRAGGDDLITGAGEEVGGG